jgi:Lipocalin-like domain
MKRTIACFVALTALCLGAFSAKAEESVQGVWNVTKFQIKVLETGQIVEPFGPQVRGYYIYGKTHFSRMVTSANRMVNSVPPKDEEVLALFRSMGAYGGTYIQVGNKLTVKREFASREDMVGTNPTGTIEFNGNVQTLTSSIFKNAAGKDAVFVITMDRLE